MSTIASTAPRDAAGPRLRSGEIHLWPVSLHAAAARLQSLDTLLTDEERDRALRYRFPDDRRRFIVARGTLRRLLAAYLERDAGGLAIGTDRCGKPYLSNPGRPLQFNLAHSGDRALIALSRDAAVGVDLEDLAHESRAAELGASIGTPGERAVIDSLPHQERGRALLRLWTAKEAFLKALGTGLQIDPTRLEVPAPVAAGSDEPASIRWFDSPGVASRFALYPLPACEVRLGASAALAAARGTAGPHRIRWMGGDFTI